MATLDTGAIDNRQEPLTNRLTVRLTNTGSQQAIAGIELYYIEQDGDGYGSQIFYNVRLISLEPLGQPGATYALENAYAAFDVIGVRIVTSGLGGSDVTAVVERLDDAGRLLARQVLGGELSQADSQIMAYVGTNFGNLNVLDTVKNTVITTIRGVPNGTSGAAVAPDGTRVYAANGPTITVIDTATNAIADIISLPPGVTVSRLAVSLDGLTAYGVGSNDSAYVIDLASHAVTDAISLAPGGQTPVAIALSPDGLRAYTSNRGNSTVSVIDTALKAVVATIDLTPLHGRLPNDLLVTPNGLQVYTANQNTTFSVIDTVTNSLISCMSTGGLTESTAIAITPDGSRVYTANPSNFSISYICGTQSTALAVFKLSLGGATIAPRALAVTPDGSRLLITGDQFVFVFDTFSNEIIGTIPCNVNTKAIVITPIKLF